MDNVTLRSFKLRFDDVHVRIVPATTADGCPFSGPGVDLRGDAAEAALSLGTPLVEVLASLEPGLGAARADRRPEASAVEPCAGVRSLAVDLERPRVTVTFYREGSPVDARPSVVRLDEGAILERLIEASAPLRHHLAAAASTALARRAAIDAPPRGADSEER